MRKPFNCLELDDEEEVIAKDNSKAIDATQELRFSLIKKQLENGVPTDKDSVELLLKISDSLSKTAQQNLRLDIEQTSANNDKMIFEIAERLHKMNVSSGVGLKPLREVPPPPAGELLPSDIKIDEGVKEKGIVQESSEEFMARMKKEKQLDD